MRNRLRRDETIPLNRASSRLSMTMARASLSSRALIRNVNGIRDPGAKRNRADTKRAGLSVEKSKLGSRLRARKSRSPNPTAEYSSRVWKVRGEGIKNFRRNASRLEHVRSHECLIPALNRRVAKCSNGWARRPDGKKKISYRGHFPSSQNDSIILGPARDREITTEKSVRARARIYICVYTFAPARKSWSRIFRECAFWHSHGQKQVQRRKKEGEGGERGRGQREETRKQERTGGCRARARACSEEFRINRRDWCVVWAAARSPQLK